MASYPNSVHTFTTKNAGDTIQPAHVNDLQDEVNAIEAGLLNGTANLNSSNTTVVHMSVSAGMNVVGNSTIASSVTIGTIPYVFPASGGLTNQVLTVSSTSGSTCVLTWATPASGQTTLLKASHGSDTAAGATTVDSIAISGLTADDTIRVLLNMETSSQNTAQVNLYSVTDAQALVKLTPSPLATANPTCSGEAILKQRNGNSTNYSCIFQGMNAATTRFDDYENIGVATAWTGSWTLGLRHGGVTAGGTFKYSWAVYKQAGQ